LSLLHCLHQTDAFLASVTAPEEAALRFIGNRNRLQLETECTRLGFRWSLRSIRDARCHWAAQAQYDKSHTSLMSPRGSQDNKFLTYTFWKASYSSPFFLSEISFERMDFNLQHYVVRKFEIYYRPHVGQVQQLI
jgi:hypothetical protein